MKYLITLILLSLPAFSQNVPKTFVIEDHTGAWLGWGIGSGRCDYFFNTPIMIPKLPSVCTHLLRGA